MFEKLLEAILGLTTALNAHTAALSANPTKTTKGKAASADTPPAGSTAQPTATAQTQAATQQPATTAAATSAPSGDVQKAAQEAGAAMVRVANEISRDAAVAILTKFGAQTFAGVKPGDYEAFKAECLAALAAKAAPATGATGLL